MDSSRDCRNRRYSCVVEEKHQCAKVRTRILVVDDSRIVRRLIRNELTESGYEVFEASDGQEAVENARNRPTSLETTVRWSEYSIIYSPTPSNLHLKTLALRRLSKPTATS
ncbi:MAG: response regulator [Proteobacteria bacterium]|nr:response regulator [Pseudomonadota bacterium]